MRIAVTVVVEMNDDQVADYAAEYGLPVRGNDRPMARDVVEHVRNWALADLRRGPLGEFADVSLKR